MIEIIVGVVAAAGLAVAAYKYRATLVADVKKFETKITGSTSAFAKLAEADGKILALKVATDAKKAEATAVHDSLDEVHKILG